MKWLKPRAGDEKRAEQQGFLSAHAAVILQIKGVGGLSYSRDNVPDQVQLRREGSGEQPSSQPCLEACIIITQKKIAFHMRSHRRRGLLRRLGLVLNDSGLKRKEILPISMLFQFSTTASFTPPLPWETRRPTHAALALPSVRLLFGFSCLFFPFSLQPHSLQPKDLFIHYM